MKNIQVPFIIYFIPSSEDDEEAEVSPRKITTKQAAARGSALHAASLKNREACTAAAATAAYLPAAGGNAVGAKCIFSISDDEEAEVAPRKITTKQFLMESPEKSKKPQAISRMKNAAPPAHSASESETESAPEQHLPTSPQKPKPSASQKRTLAPAPQPAPKPPLQTTSPKLKPTAFPFPLTRVLTKISKPTSTEERCRGCLCVNPCSNLKYCLTPQTDLKKRVRVSKHIE